VSRDNKKKCLECGSTDLLCVITMTKTAPLADRNGTIKVNGVKVGQLDLKLAWDKTVPREDAADQQIRGPIVCGDCSTEHFYVVGDKRPLRIGSVIEARAQGYEHLVSN
jgi:hypothetical protein